MTRVGQTFARIQGQRSLELIQIFYARFLQMRPQEKSLRAIAKAVKDSKSFVHKTCQKLNENTSKAIDRFFNEISAIKQILDTIDKLHFSQKRYIFSNRVGTPSLYTLLALTFIAGIIFPLILLAFPKWEVSSPAAVVILITALLVLQFLCFNLDGRSLALSGLMSAIV